MLIKNCKTNLFELQNQCFRSLLKAEFFRERSNELRFIGNEYSGYWLPSDLLGQRGTIWGVGLGKESTFEYELMTNGYQFIGFEPEKECFEASREQFNGTSAIIENYGLWDKTGLFPYTGENISIVDIFNLNKAGEVLLDIRSLWDIAQEKQLQNSKAPRILKLNIEGAEREILLGLTNNPLNFEVLIFQAEFLFHIGFKRYKEKVNAYRELRYILKSFQRIGWTIVDLSRHQITLTNTQIFNHAKIQPLGESL